MAPSSRERMRRNVRSVEVDVASHHGCRLLRRKRLARVVVEQPRRTKSWNALLFGAQGARRATKRQRFALGDTVDAGGQMHRSSAYAASRLRRPIECHPAETNKGSSDYEDQRRRGVSTQIGYELPVVCYGLI